MITKKTLPTTRWKLPSQIGTCLKLWFKQRTPAYTRWRLRLYYEPDLRNALCIVATRSGQAGRKEIQG